MSTTGPNFLMAVIAIVQRFSTAAVRGVFTLRRAVLCLLLSTCSPRAGHGVRALASVHAHVECSHHGHHKTNFIMMDYGTESGTKRENMLIWYIIILNNHSSQHAQVSTYNGIMKTGCSRPCCYIWKTKNKKLLSQSVEGWNDLKVLWQILAMSPLNVH